MVSDYLVQPGGAIQGTLEMPGDKSISHRAIILASLAEGVSHIHGFLDSTDCRATINAFQQMGVTIDGPTLGSKVTVHGVGLHGLSAPKAPLDFANSGTSIRLFSGLLAAQAFSATLTGDALLQNRPMRRVTEPLEQMGAQIATIDGKPPLAIKPSRGLQAITYQLPVASAQVKSCLLLAGLYAQGETVLITPVQTRDHTEKMLKSFTYDLQFDAGRVSLRGGGRLQACDVQIPGDISSAAFFMVGASICRHGSKLLLKNIGINPTRTGVIDILRLMGANIHLKNQRCLADEPVADIEVTAAPLRGIRIPENLVALAIDEFPILCVAAACAQGETILRGAAELRFKESDRIYSMIDGLKQLGIECEAYPDGLRIIGGVLQGGCVGSLGDHRVAMSFALAALRAEGPILIKDSQNVATSFPNFVRIAKQAGLELREMVDI